jgi:hypothetical protein
MAYQGQCACGAVTATISAEPVTVRQCWCRDCQRISGGGPTHNAIFPVEAVVLKGELGSHGHAAASGNTLTKHYCLSCGTPVYATSSARMHLQTFRLGFLADGHGLRPSAAIWTDSAPDWAYIDPALEQWAAQPPAPAMPQD